MKIFDFLLIEVTKNMKALPSASPFALNSPPSSDYSLSAVSKSYT